MQVDHFGIGDVAGFLRIVRLLKVDSEFCLAFDFGLHHLEIQSMALGGVVGIGIHLVQSSVGILEPSPFVRSDRVVLRIDSGILYQTLLVLNKIEYERLSIGVNVDDDTIEVNIYDADCVKVGSATINTLQLNEHDTDFIIIKENQLFSYETTLCQSGKQWRTYLQPTTIDLTMIYNGTSKQLTWETRNTQSKIVLYMQTQCQASGDVRVCVLPAVIEVLRSLLQVTETHATTLSIRDDKPICMYSTLDTSGSFIRVYAGTKDDE